MSRQVCGGKKWVEKGETTCFFLFSLLRENLTKVSNLCKINYSFILVFIIYLYLFLDFLELILYQFIVIKLYVIKIKYSFLQDIFACRLGRMYHLSWVTLYMWQVPLWDYLPPLLLSSYFYQASSFGLSNWSTTSSSEYRDQYLIFVYFFSSSFDKSF